MDFAFSDEQLLLKDAARRFLEKECAPDIVRQIRDGDRQSVRELWSKMADLGWLGLPLSESYGGLGSDWVSLAALIEELGRVADPTPYINSIVASALLIEAMGTEAQKQALLPPIARGEMLVSLSVLESEAVYQPGAIGLAALPAGDGLMLNGRKLFVENADIADRLLLAVRTAQAGERGITMVLVDPKAEGVEVKPLHSVTLAALSEVSFHDVAVSNEQIIGAKDEAWPVLWQIIKQTAAVQCASAAGGAARVLEMAVAYAKERHQFDQPIGAFQAIQHMLADRYGDVETAWLAAYDAVAALDQGDSDLDGKIAVGKVFCSQAFTRCCLDAHQVFAGLGYMWKTDLHYWTRKAKEIEFSWGTPTEYRRQLARCL